MKTGMVAAEAAFDALTSKDRTKLRLIADYPMKLSKSWVWDELYRVRNIRPAFRWGLWIGLLYSALGTYVFRGKAPGPSATTAIITLFFQRNVKKFNIPARRNSHF